MYYVKEHGFNYQKKHGPYESLQEAMANKPANRPVGDDGMPVHFTIESEQGGTQTFLTE